MALTSFVTANEANCNSHVNADHEFESAELPVHDDHACKAAADGAKTNRYSSSCCKYITMDVGEQWQVIAKVIDRTISMAVGVILLVILVLLVTTSLSRDDVERNRDAAIS